MRKHIVAGNWKMNNDLPQTEVLISNLKMQSQNSNAEVMIAPTHTNLWHAFEALRQSNIEVIAQNMHFAENGAYTGEVSAAASALQPPYVYVLIISKSSRVCSQ